MLNIVGNSIRLLLLIIVAIKTPFIVFGTISFLLCLDFVLPILNYLICLANKYNETRFAKFMDEVYLFIFSWVIPILFFIIYYFKGY